MSWLEELKTGAANLYNAVTSSPIASSVVKTAAMGLVLYQVNKSVNKKNQTPSPGVQADRYVREQLSPDSSHSVPVVYGTSFIKGIITDAVMTDDNMTMWYCITICEKTGTLLSSGAASTFTFDEVYLNGNKITFQSDGVTVQSTTDSDGIVDNQMNGFVKIYCFNDGSNSPVTPTGYTNGNLLYARDLMPNWTANHMMNDLIFALVRVDYNKERNVTGLGEIEFKITNSMTMPGDVLNDYMLNTRYGAGIPASEIYSS